MKTFVNSVNVALRSVSVQQKGVIGNSDSLAIASSLFFVAIVVCCY